MISRKGTNAIMGTLLGLPTGDDTDSESDLESDSEATLESSTPILDLTPGDTNYIESKEIFDADKLHYIIT